MAMIRGAWCLTVLSLALGSDSDVASCLQVEQRHSAGMAHSSAYNRSVGKRMSNTVVLSNNLYWQGYGGQTLWSYFIGFLGQDQVNVGGVAGKVKLGLNLIGNAPLGNMYQSVSTDSGMLGLLPGCFSSKCNGPEDYDDLLSDLARQGKMKRAFTMCFDDGPEGGGKLYLGKPELLFPQDVTSISMVPLTSGRTYYSPLSTFDNNDYVEFYFGHLKVGSQKVLDWNNMMQQGYGYSDTGTPGLMMPPQVLTKIINEIRNGVASNQRCQSLWGYQLQILAVGAPLQVNQPAVECAQRYVKDFEVKLGPGVSLTVSKSSLFYETEPCSGKYGISWTSSGSEAFVFGTAFNYGKTVLYDTSDLAAPKMLVLGKAAGCKTDYSADGAKPLPMSGVAGQVLGDDGTITTQLYVGTPGQEITVQLDTGSQKFMGIHHTCRNLGNCFLVQPVDGRNTELLPGNEYHTEFCQRQINDISMALSQQPCYEVQGKTLCECASQEDCLSLVMRAAAQNVVPNKICAISRKICGDRVDFEPDHSSSFQPSHFPNYAFVRPPGKQQLTAQCHLTHLCDEPDYQEESADNDYGYYDDWSKGSASHDDVNKRTDADNYEYSNY